MILFSYKMNNSNQIEYTPPVKPKYNNRDDYKDFYNMMDENGDFIDMQTIERSGQLSIKEKINFIPK